MWKPGTAKLDNPPKKSRDNNASSESPKGGSAKKLSSATMGMRFMQRKVEASALVKKQEERKSVMQVTCARKNNIQQNSQKNENGINDNRTNDSLERKRDSDSMSKESAHEMIILDIASVVDMYGVGADVVGRRSFGGFHKAVRTTWEAAIKIRTEEDARSRATKSHITDEELLQRYEKYVKGRGEGFNFVGRKEKRKRS